MSNIGSKDHKREDGKREIKIYKKTYRLPMLAGGKLDQLQKQIRERNEHLTKGKLVTQKVEQKGMFGKKFVEQRTLKSLSFEERYLELNEIVQNYDDMVKVLKRHQYDYQRFFQELAQEIRETIGETCSAIQEKEQKRQVKEKQERQKSNPSPQNLAMLKGMESQLFDIAKSTGYAAVLMLKKLDLMSESLRKIASDQDSQKQLLAQVLEEIRSQKDLYELQLEINALQTKTAEYVDIALNFEKYMKPFMGSFQSLLSNVANVDQELSKAMGEIQNIASLLEAQEFRNFERDGESQRIADFLLTGEMKKDRIQQAVSQMGNVQAGAEFDAKLLGAGQGVTLDACLVNIRGFLDVKLDNLKVIDVPVIEDDEIEHPTSSRLRLGKKQMLQPSKTKPQESIDWTQGLVSSEEPTKVNCTQGVVSSEEPTKVNTLTLSLLQLVEAYSDGNFYLIESCEESAFYSVTMASIIENRKYSEFPLDLTIANKYNALFWIVKTADSGYVLFPNPQIRIDQLCIQRIKYFFSTQGFKDGQYKFLQVYPASVDLDRSEKWTRIQKGKIEFIY